MTIHALGSPRASSAQEPAVRKSCSNQLGLTDCPCSLDIRSGGEIWSSMSRMPRGFRATGRGPRPCTRATARPARAGTVRSAALPSTELAPRSRSVRPRSAPDAPARPPSPQRRRGATRDSDEGARDSAARCRAPKAGDPGPRPCACTTLQTLGRLEFPELDSDACDRLDHDRAGRSCSGRPRCARASGRGDCRGDAPYSPAAGGAPCTGKRGAWSKDRESLRWRDRRPWPVVEHRRTGAASRRGNHGPGPRGLAPGAAGGAQSMVQSIRYHYDGPTRRGVDEVRTGHTDGTRRPEASRN